MFKRKGLEIKREKRLKEQYKSTLKKKGSLASEHLLKMEESMNVLFVIENYLGLV